MGKQPGTDFVFLEFNRVKVTTALLSALKRQETGCVQTNPLFSSILGLQLPRLSYPLLQLLE
jgi:hypothetical protein